MHAPNLQVKTDLNAILKVHKYFIILQESFTSEQFLRGLLNVKRSLLILNKTLINSQGLVNQKLWLVLLQNLEHNLKF